MLRNLVALCPLLRATSSPDVRGLLQSLLHCAVAVAVSLQISGMFKPPPEQEDVHFQRTKFMLKNLGLAVGGGGPGGGRAGRPPDA